MEKRTHEPLSRPAEVASSGRIDVQAYCVPPAWQALPMASAPLFRGFMAWSVPAALEMMDRQGIAIAVLSMVFRSEFEQPLCGPAFLMLAGGTSPSAPGAC